MEKEEKVFGKLQIQKGDDKKEQTQHRWGYRELNTVLEIDRDRE